MSSDLLHAIVAGVLIGGVVWGTDRSGLLAGRSKLQRFGIVFAIGFVAMFVLNLIWPVGP